MTFIFLIDLFVGILAFWFTALLLVGLIGYLRGGPELTVGTVLAILFTLAILALSGTITALSLYISTDTLTHLTGNR